ncbi:alpha/beta fold hydrolase [Natronocella acetinitrilica]|nr:alpha/beta hydrolase [Natronocella acetinitrilica]
MFPVQGPAGPLGGIIKGVSRVGDTDPPLVLLHGIQGTARSWKGVMELLPAGVSAVAPNLRGRADSVTPEQPADYEIAHFADDVAAVIEALGRPVILAGWSMGVLVALGYIKAHGLANVCGLALISGSPYPGRHGANWFLGDTVDAIADEAEGRARRMGLSETAHSIAVAGSWLACKATNHADVLREIHCPVAVIHGTEDDQCPLSHARFMAQSVPDGRLHEFHGRSHSILAEAPEDVADALLALRQRCLDTST